MARTKQKRVIKANANATKRPRSARKGRGKSVSIGKYFLPGLLCLIFLSGLGFFGIMGYRTVTASDFFEVRRIEIRGTERASREDINKLIEAAAVRSGAWNIDLEELRAKVEKITFVRSAAVTRIRPNGIQIDVLEKKPEAIVSLSSGNYLIDSDGEIITRAAEIDARMPAMIRGWDESKTEKAINENRARVKLYQKMVEQWSDFGLLQRVKEVDLKELREPRVVIEDSGARISVALAKDELGKSLKSAVEAVAGKGEKIRSVNAAGLYPLIEYVSN
jgi:cell division septal protein FtsQ